MIHNIYDLEVSLSNIWMIGLFRSNKQDGNSKTEEKVMSQQLRKWFKIATNSIIRGSNFFFNIKIRSKCCFLRS